MPFTSCVSFVSDAGKRRSCPSWLMAALGISFGNVLLTDPFDVLFARIYSNAQASQIHGCISRSIRITYRSLGNRGYHAVFPVFYFTVRRFILRKYDRSCVNNVSVNNEPGVSAMLVRLPQLKGCDR